MAEETQYKAYRSSTNGEDYYSISPWVGNVPYGHTPITNEQYIAGKQGQLAANATRWQPYYDQQAGVESKMLSGAGTGYQMVNGVPTNSKGIAEQTANDAAVAAGTMRKVPVGNGFGYVPTGSAADKLQAGIASGQVSATNPEAQLAASMQGNNVNAVNAVDTSRPSPSTVDATPYTQGIQQGLQAAQASGLPAPQTSGDALGAVNSFLPTSGPTFYKPDDNSQQVYNAKGEKVSYDQYIAQGGKSDFTNVQKGHPTEIPSTPNVDNFFQANKTLQEQTKELMDFLQPAQLQDQLFQQMSKITAGQNLIAKDKLELMNLENVMSGSAEDIALEITKASGFATNSQVQALAVARNNTLLKQASFLQNKISYQQDMIANDTTLLNFEKEMAQNQFQQRLGVYQLVQQNQQNQQQAARDSISTLMNTPGGLASYLSNPNQATYAEKIMGFAPGTITNLANQQQQQLLAQQQAQALDLEAKRTSIDTNKFQLAQAKAEAPLDMRLKIAQINAANRSNVSQPKARDTQIVDMGNGKKVLVDSGTGAIINEIGANPTDQLVKGIISSANSWGDAADKINKAFGDPNAATRYDAQLKAVYQQGQNVNNAFTASSPQSEQSLAQAKGNIDLISGLLKNSNLSSAVGPNALARTSLTNFITGGKDNVLSEIQQLTSQLSLDSLIRAKSQGATFGALSEGELRLLSASATKLSSLATKDKNGNITGYKSSERDFKAELDKINNFAKLDYVKKGGNPEDVGIQRMPDGKLLAPNSDGTYQEF